MFQREKRWTILFKLLLSFIILITAFNVYAYDSVKLESVAKKLSSLDIVMPEPGPSDWLASHAEEGQSLADYLADPFKKEDAKHYIYIQPIGKFAKDDRRILMYVAKYLEIFYGYKTKIKADIDSQLIGAEGRRNNPIQGNLQFSAPYIIENILETRIPEDAVAFLGFTSTDLWPGDDWNYVFGLATPESSTGVWSLARLRSMSQGTGFDSKLLLRAAKLASHETAHMFGIMHNKDHIGLMNGVNHIKESDRTPMYLNSSNLAKLLSFSDLDIKDRYQKLVAWCDKYAFTHESAEFSKRLKLFSD